MIFYFIWWGCGNIDGKCQICYISHIVPYTVSVKANLIKHQRVFHCPSYLLLPHLSVIDCSMLSRHCEDHHGDESDHFLHSVKAWWKPCSQHHPYQLIFGIHYLLGNLSILQSTICPGCVYKLHQNMGYIPEAVFPKMQRVNISLIQSCSSVSLPTSLSEG